MSRAVDVMAVAEFFVLRGARRTGVGTRATHALLELLPGAWEVRVRCTTCRPAHRKRRAHKRDRTAKLSIYARESVPNAWLINPEQRTLEVLRLTSQGRLTLAVHHDDQHLRAEPFDAIELDLGVLWSDLAPEPPR